MAKRITLKTTTRMKIEIFLLSLSIFRSMIFKNKFARLTVWEDFKDIFRTSRFEALIG